MHKLRVISSKIDNLDEINALIRASKGYLGYDEAFLNKFIHIYSKK